MGWNGKTVESDMERSVRRLAWLSPPAANEPSPWVRDASPAPDSARAQAAE